MTTKEIWALYSTFPSQAEALSVARMLVEKRLVACANILENMVSVYRWQGGIQQEPEVALFAKTTKDNVKAAIEAIKNQHSYQLPCIVAYPVSEGFTPFMQWVVNETTGTEAP